MMGTPEGKKTAAGGSLQDLDRGRLTAPPEEFAKVGTRNRDLRGCSRPRADFGELFG